jgi:hypothetical protein
MKNRNDPPVQTSDATSTQAMTGGEASTEREPPDPERVAHRAYERFQLRGGEHGRDQDDWFEAERDLADRPGDS